MIIPLFFLFCSYPYFLTKYYNNTTKLKMTTFLDDFFKPKITDVDWDSGEVPWDIDLANSTTKPKTNPTPKPKQKYSQYFPYILQDY